MKHIRVAHFIITSPSSIQPTQSIHQNYINTSVFASCVCIWVGLCEPNINNYSKLWKPQATKKKQLFPEKSNIIKKCALGQCLAKKRDHNLRLIVRQWFHMPISISTNLTPTNPDQKIKINIWVEKKWVEPLLCFIFWRLRVKLFGISH